MEKASQKFVRRRLRRITGRDACASLTTDQHVQAKQNELNENNSSSKHLWGATASKIKFPESPPCCLPPSRFNEMHPEVQTPANPGMKTSSVEIICEVSLSSKLSFRKTLLDLAEASTVWDRTKMNLSMEFQVFFGLFGLILCSQDPHVWLSSNLQGRSDCQSYKWPCW